MLCQWTIGTKIDADERENQLPQRIASFPAFA
jgi:hypothetical protein